MVKSERQATQGLSEGRCARCVLARRAGLKQGYSFIKRKHVKCDLIG